MEPFAHQPAIMFLLVNLETIRAVVDPGPAPVPGTDSDGLPACIVSVGWETISCEGVLGDVELEVGAVQIGG